MWGGGDAPIVTLTTDFGTADGYAGAMKGVLSALAPRARILDLSHELPAHDVTAGAWLLLRAVPFFPPGTVHLAVVDPGVGSRRRGLVLEIGGHYCVGPDNGIFSLLPARLGGPLRAVVLDRARIPALPSTSAVFEGRDVFAPAAAVVVNDLAVGEVDLARLGEPIEDFTRLPWTEPRPRGEDWLGEVVRVDRFGNAITNLTPAHGAGPLAAGGRRVSRGRAYADAPPGAAIALEGSAGFLEIAVNQGSAARELGLEVGSPVELLNEGSGS